LADGEVDIGAYEFGAPFRPRPCPIVPVAGVEPAVLGSR
jgi:hypothetical protein